VILISGHYDVPRQVFVGANDGGSSAVLVIELARPCRQKTRPQCVGEREHAINAHCATLAL